MLTEMLRKNKAFQTLNREKQDLLIRLASIYQEDFQYLYLSPEELAEETGTGNKNQWQDLLALDITGAYIKQQMGMQIQVAQRKAVQALQAQAQVGNTQAAKQITELAGVLNQQDSNKVIILHQINRPKVKREIREEKETGQNV